jgi:hypothetical protein
MAMTHKEKTNMAILVVKCLRASWASPEPTDPLVKEWAAKPDDELRKKHEWAVQAHGAMTWNTMLAGGPVTR